MRSTQRLAQCLVFVCSATVLSAQAVVESAVAAGAASSAAAGMRGAGAAAGGVFRNLSTTVNRQSGSRSQVINVPDPAAAAKDKKQKGRSRSSRSAASVSVPVAKPPAKLPDPSLITLGMRRADVLKQFGEPSMRTGGSFSGHLQESFVYSNRDYEEVIVRFSDGAVADVAASPGLLRAANSEPPSPKQ